MKVHLEEAHDSYRVDAYGQGYVIINRARLASSLIVTPDRLIADWPPEHLAELTREHMAMIADCGMEIALLGTGAHQQFPDAALSAPLVDKGVSLEVMSTAAACRTFNILVSEGRLVAAALLMI